MELSVCICTWNRARSLAETLLTVAHALDGAPEAEVVVVDNACDDDTAAVLARFQRLLPLRALREPRPGLSHARNAAVRAARGELVAFTDDDVLWTRGGLAALAEAARRHPEAHFFGGRVLPWWPHRPPRWLRDPSLDLIAGVLGHYAPDSRSRALDAGDPLPIGACFALRRSVLEAVGGFDPELGLAGARRRRGEETDLLARAVAAGFRGRYVAEARCYHRVDPRNLGLRRLFELGVEKGLAGTPRPGARRRQGALALRALLQMLTGRGDRARQCVVWMGIEQGGLGHGRG